MTDIVGRLFNLPIVFNAIASALVAGGVWWKFYTISMQEAQKIVAQETKKQFDRGDKQIQQGNVVVGVANKYTAAQTAFNPLAPLIAKLTGGR